ncbi:hypothetical protein [Cellulomonas sp. Root137]|uniref:hypothetical protein n=1 Tax=Cellulomonas sp. Root137 TaxID=1736459 RepID=UPI0006F9ABDB|nr:hypothetical protein [Cellulomonas sp. Root137]KQY44344.1 hypothetical protein ASD18_12435 [Cellulomonas sp. Root137]
MRKVAYGIYVAVPDDVYDPGRWRPSFEAAAGAVATAIFGDQGAVLMGMAAARLQGAVPRAHGLATVAAPRRHRAVALTDRSFGVIEFVTRDLDAIDAQLLRTELGGMLVTTAEQTIVDLARDRTTHESDLRDAMRNLGYVADWSLVEELAGNQRGGGVVLPGLRRLRRELNK